MRLIFLFFFCLLLKLSIAVAPDTYDLRKLYYYAAANKDSASKFLMVMENLDVKTDPLLLCYKGMANLIQANHSFNPYSKLAFFIKGKDMLEKAIMTDPKNIEICFMRFCVQTNAPFFLGYSMNINSDKLIIIKGWGKLLDLDLKEKIREYILTSSSFSPNEKIMFK